MKTIYKYPMPAGGGSRRTMPKGFKPLSVGLDPHDVLCLWAEVDTEAPLVKVDFAAVGTGWDFEDLKAGGVNLEEYTFIGTVYDGLIYMWHYYYKILEDV